MLRLNSELVAFSIGKGLALGGVLCHKHDVSSFK